MKIITLIRLFTLFPLAGIVIPNVAFTLNNTEHTVPLIQLIACIVLGLVIIASFGLQLFHPKFKSR